MSAKPTSESTEKAPSLEELAVDEAHTKLLGNCGHAVGMRTVFCHTCGPRILTRLYLAAKIEALTQLREREWHVRENGLDGWFIPSSAVHEALSRLREESR